MSLQLFSVAEKLLKFIITMLQNTQRSAIFLLYECLHLITTHLVSLFLTQTLAYLLAISPTKNNLFMQCQSTDLYIKSNDRQRPKIFTITHVKISLVMDESTSSVKPSITYPTVYHINNTLVYMRVGTGSQSCDPLAVIQMMTWM